MDHFVLIHHHSKFREPFLWKLLSRMPPPSFGLDEYEITNEKIVEKTALTNSEQMREIAHIINPFIVGKSSDLFVAQPLTFETMRIAKEFARDRADVTLFSAQYL